MRICYLSKEYPPNVIGGVGIYIKEIAQAISRLGHDVFIITQALNNIEREYKNGKITVIEIPFRELGFFSFLRDYLPKTIERLEYSFLVSKRLSEITKKYKIDIVETSEARGEAFWYYLFKNKPPLVIKLHTPESIIFKWNGGVNEADIKFIEQLEKIWFNKANLTIGVTKSIINFVDDLYGLNSDNCPIVPNPLDLDLFKASQNLQDHQIEPTILYTGRLEFRKGVHILIRAMLLVLQKLSEVKFIYIGADCGMKWYLDKKIKEYNCKENVTILDQLPREDLIQYYKKATICIVPSLWENFPYACLEPMALGKPVIASNVGGISEVIKDGYTGLLFTPGSPNALAEKIIDLLKDDKLREHIGTNAAKHIRKLCDPMHIANKMVNIYQKLLKC